MTIAGRISPQNAVMTCVHDFLDKIGGLQVILMIPKFSVTES